MLRDRTTSCYVIELRELRRANLDIVGVGLSLYFIGFTFAACVQRQHGPYNLIGPVLHFSLLLEGVDACFF